MHVLDRILHRDDVARALVVEAVDHAGKGRGLTGAGGARYEHHAALVADLVEHVLGNVHGHGVGQAEGDHADDGAEGPALAEDVHAEAADAVD